MRKDRSKIAVFLDRDGTVNMEEGYLKDLKHFTLYPRAGKAIKILNRLGVRVIIVSNQSGIGRGYFGSDLVKKVHQKLKRILFKEGARLDAIYYCPHHPKEDCDCRKPKTRMLEKAKERFGLDFSQSYVVGDKLMDIELGKKVGAKTILVLTGYGRKERKKIKYQTKSLPDMVVDNLFEATRWVEQDLKSRFERLEL